MTAGPIPKEASVRARRNKNSTNAILRAVPGAKVPTLPKGRKWHPMTVAWWTDTWKSPMAPEFTESDFHGIARMSYIVDLYHLAADDEDLRTMLATSVEIRHLGQSFGLTPIDRRRLQWTIEQGEAAEEKTTQRRNTQAQVRKPRAVPSDPRELLG